MSNIEARVEVKLYYNGALLLDEAGARLLSLIDKYGSLLAASRVLGIPYSRAWEIVSRVERRLGEKIIERRRGARGGASLTATGKRLLEKYAESYHSLTGKVFEAEASGRQAGEEGKGIYAGSHDIAVGKLLDTIYGRGGYEVHWIGSLNGISSLLLGEATITGLHILDPASGEYNIPYLREYYGGSGLLLIKGWQRSIGIASRINAPLNELIDMIMRGEASIINRNPGSGSRILLDTILTEEMKRRNFDPSLKPSIIRGYGRIVRTHIDIAEEIISGRADAGVCIEYVAKAYHLHFHRIKWERFDLVLRDDEKNLAEKISRQLRTRGGEIVSGLTGYRASGESGTIVRI